MIVLSEGDKEAIRYLVDHTPDKIANCVEAQDMAGAIAWAIVQDEAQIVLDDGVCVDQLLVWRLTECARYMQGPAEGGE